MTTSVLCAAIFGHMMVSLPRCDGTHVRCAPKPERLRLDADEESESEAASDPDSDSLDGRGTDQDSEATLVMGHPGQRLRDAF